jgi:hypothetical protein
MLGIARERERFRGKPFVLLCLRYDRGPEGLFSSLELIEGFVEKDSAILKARQQADRALARALAPNAHPSGAYRWEQVEPKWPPFRPQEKTHTETITSVFAQRFQVEDRCALEWKYFKFEVLHVRTPDIIGPELFCFIDDEWAWQSFFVERGTPDPDNEPLQARETGRA